MGTNLSVIDWAAKQAEEFLSPLGNRWLHTQGVVERAREVGSIFNEKDRSLLIAAAFLHDIGYAPSLKITGFHPIDGAYYLLAQHQERLASLIAYHFEAHFEARLRGLVAELNTIPREDSLLADALSYCDVRTGPTGQHLSFEERLADIFQRYDENDIIYLATCQAIPSLTRLVEHVQGVLFQHKQQFALAG